MDDKDLPIVTLDDKSKQKLSDTASTTSTIFEDLSEIGDQVDLSKATLEQLRDEVRKFRREQLNFETRIKNIISYEIEAQVRPLADQLKKFTSKRQRIVYIKFKIPLLDSLKALYAKIRNK